MKSGSSSSEHLGELKIKVAVEHGVVSAEFVAETAAVKSIIEAHLLNSGQPCKIWAQTLLSSLSM